MSILPLIQNYTVLDSKTTTPTQPKMTSFWPLNFFFFFFFLKMKIEKKKKGMKIEGGSSHPLGQNWVVWPLHFWPRGG
jgi:hypothetical protein